jgi:hypothetical protein
LQGRKQIEKKPRMTWGFFVHLPVGEDGRAGLPDGLLGSAGFPEGFIGLGLLAVLPTALPVVVVPGAVPVVEPAEGEGLVPMVPEDAPPEAVPPAPAAPPVWANAIVLESASAPANTKVMIFMVVSCG